MTSPLNNTLFETNHIPISLVQTNGKENVYICFFVLATNKTNSELWSKRLKTIAFEAAHTYLAHKRKYPTRDLKVYKDRQKHPTFSGNKIIKINLSVKNFGHDLAFTRHYKKSEIVRKIYMKFCFLHYLELTIVGRPLCQLFTFYDQACNRKTSLSQIKIMWDLVSNQSDWAFKPHF